MAKRRSFFFYKNMRVPSYAKEIIIFATGFIAGGMVMIGVLLGLSGG
jgi:hypothetical protein